MGRRIAVVLFILAETAAAFAAFVLAFQLHQSIRGWEPDIFTRWGHFTWPFRPYIPILVLVPLIRLLCAWRSGGFRMKGAYSLSGDLSGIVRATVFGSLCIVIVAALSRDEGLWLALAGWEYGSVSPDRRTEMDAFFNTFNYSRPLFLIDLLVYGCLSVLLRLAVRRVQVGLRKRGINLIPVVVVGNGEEADTLKENISRKRRLGRKVVDQIQTTGNTASAELLDKLRESLSRCHAEEIIFSGSTLSHGQLFQLIMDCELTTPVDVKLVPNISELVTRKLSLTRLGDIPVLALMGDPIGPANRFVKRTVDIVGSLLLLIIFLPLLAVIAFLIKRDSPGPVLYKQTRVGQDGRLFACYKFRSMLDKVSAGRHQELMKTVISGGAADDSQGPGQDRIYKEKDDPRITRVGRMLRRYSLDELPQIYNVLRGDMSLVGPRPPIPYEVREYLDWHRGRLATRPGITGLWQVGGRNEISFEDMVRLDIYYIENYSLLMDLRILLQTVPAMLKGCGL